MSAVFWEEAVVSAVYILKRSPTKALYGRTPYEAWHGHKLAVSHLRVFGYLTFAKELGHISKLDDRSTPGVFIGYMEGSKAYRILEPIELATPLSHDEERINTYHDGEPLRYRTMENLLSNQPVPGLVPHDLEAQLHLACDDNEPRSFVEAERHVTWRATMQLEMDAVEKNRT
jgi:hypothetical protein